MERFLIAKLSKSKILKRLFLVLFIALITSYSCKKAPKACIEFSPSQTVNVFETITLKSCSDNSESFSWEVEQPLVSLESSNAFYTGKVVDHIWEAPGNFTVSLTGISKNEKKQDIISETITVKDICYLCTSSPGSEYLECASNYLTKEEFDEQVDYWLTNGYTCNLQ